MQRCHLLVLALTLLDRAPEALVLELAPATSGAR